MSQKSHQLSDIVSAVAVPFTKAADLDALVDAAGEARVVMLGESSHGTEEFYAWRSILSQRLLAEKGFNFIAAEGDWPDCYRYNRYIKGYDKESQSTEDIAKTYRRWPQWMWANTATAELLGWLRRHNDALNNDKKIGFYGLDVYSLWDSLASTVDYVRTNHPESLDQAIAAYKCFEPYREDASGYAYDQAWTNTDCREEVVNMLIGLIKAQPHFPEDPEEHFNAEQNALVAVNAERYYRSLMEGQAESWNIRDRHMMEALERLLKRYGRESKAIIWAHNTHIGDARATDMKDAKMINIGQLIRERFGAEDTFALGIGTYQGKVIAAKQWDERAEVMDVPPSLQDSWDDVFHRTGIQRFYLPLRNSSKLDSLQSQRLQRAIGVVYDPNRERHYNYVPTALTERYDGYLFFDQTSALTPLTDQHADTEIPETYPSAV